MDRFQTRPWLWGVFGAAIAVPAVAYAVRRRSGLRRPFAALNRFDALRKPRILSRLSRIRRHGRTSPPSGRRSDALVRRWFFHAPRERVFAYWTAITDFPDFMDSVENVRETRPGCYRMRLRGPAGATTTWDVAIERLVPGSLVEWTSDPASEVRCAGTAEFLPVEGGGTLVEIRMDYGTASPWLAAGMERFLQSDLPALISRDVLRMKELIEKGSAGL